MPGREEDFTIWKSLWERMDAFAATLSRYKARDVNASSVRHEAREIVLGYFREVKPALQRLGVTSAPVSALESEMQRLIGLAAGKNSKASYQKVVRNIRGKRREIETGLEFLIGPVTPEAQFEIGSAEAAILSTLRTMLPAAAKSYEQVSLDIRGAGRVSYRGTAADLREVVREVLDHLAPDEDVMKSAGFRLEQDQNGPTMKQKVRFILRARRAGDSTRQTAEDSVQHLDENIASLGRSVYTRGAAAVHTARPREEVLNLKGYADAVLAELLAIHKSSREAAGEA
jgi:predicted pPIWI-associating nuclease